jgi:hypothetical protein
VKSEECSGHACGVRACPSYVTMGRHCRCVMPVLQEPTDGAGGFHRHCYSMIEVALPNYGHLIHVPGLAEWGPTWELPRAHGHGQKARGRATEPDMSACLWC